MPTYRSTPLFEHGQPERTGVLIVNLGTPTEPTATAVRRFLRQFLSDPRVIEYPRVLWWLILNLIILVIRPSRSAAAYRKIWTEDGSPLMVHSKAIASALEERLNGDPDKPMPVELAMTYGEPTIDSAVQRLVAAGARRIVALPLYPQYSATTTAAVYEQLTASLNQYRWLPELRFISQYHDDPAYIEALADSIRENWRQNGRGDKLLMSFHGVPLSTLLKGDPYHCQCRKTGRLLAESLGLADDEWLLSFQSRVGREEWLTPYTEQTVKELGAKGINQLDVVCPGFSTDCLETLEEIALQNAEFFSAAGGGELRYIAALNSRDGHIRCLADLVLTHSLGFQGQSSESAGKASSERALAMGASA